MTDTKECPRCLEINPMIARWCWACGKSLMPEREKPQKAIEIEDGIPFPTKRNRPALGSNPEIKDPFDRCNVGQSFAIPKANAKKYVSYMNRTHNKQSNKWFVSATRGSVVRFWRKT